MQKINAHGVASHFRNYRELLGRRNDEQERAPCAGGELQERARHEVPSARVGKAPMQHDGRCSTVGKVQCHEYGDGGKACEPCLPELWAAKRGNYLRRAQFARVEARAEEGIKRENAREAEGFANPGDAARQDGRHEGDANHLKAILLRASPLEERTRCVPQHASEQVPQRPLGNE